MKRHAYILSLAACSVALAGQPDTDGAIKTLEGVQHQLDDTNLQLRAAGWLNDQVVGYWNASTKETAHLQNENAHLKTDIADLQTENAKVKADAAAQADSKLDWIQQLFYDSLGGILLLGGVVCILRKDYGDAGILIAMGVSCFSSALAIQHYGQQIALVAAIADGAIVLVGIIWLLWRSHQNKTDGVNQASVVDALEAAGLPAEWVAKARALQYKLVGSAGDAMTAAASGKSVAQAQDDGKAAVTQVATLAAVSPTPAPAATAV